MKKENNNINSALTSLSKNDKVMLRIIKKKSKCNLRPKRKYFTALLKSIIGQQLSVKAANSIIDKFFNYFNGNPTVDLIIETDDEIIRSLGLSAAKTRYVKDLSYKIKNNELSLKGLAKLTNIEIEERFTKVLGIGSWTVHMFLMFTLGRLNVLPTGDLGIRKAIMLNYGFKKLPTVKEVEQIAKKNKWTPYQSVASWYLWQSID